MYVWVFTGTRSIRKSHPSLIVQRSGLLSSLHSFRSLSLCICFYLPYSLAGILLNQRRICREDFDFRRRQAFIPSIPFFFGS